MGNEQSDKSGFNESFNKSMSIQLPHPDDRDWPVFILRSVYVAFPTLSASVGASYAAHLSFWWTLLFAVIAVGPSFLGTLVGFVTDARKPGSRTRRSDGNPSWRPPKEGKESED